MTDGVDVAVRLSQRDFPSGEEIGQVVLASSATFADALSSAVMQADGPLLLTMPGRLPLAVQVELRRLQPLQVVLLGGTAAISADVEDEVAGLGLPVVRIEGPTRIETAIAVATAAAPTVDSAILVRAFDTADGDGSAAWADSVTAGALAAQNGAPILLTETDVLTGSARTYLRDSGVTNVLIVGGEAAVSRAVQQQLLEDGHRVERIAGRNRYETALVVAQGRGVRPGGRAVLVEDSGDMGWQTGISVSGHAARSGAAILPVAATGIPADIAAGLTALRPAAFTCVVSRDTCEEARALMGLPPLPVVSYNPSPGSALAADEFLVVGADDPGRQLRGEAQVTSDCPTSPIQYLPEGSASFSLSTTTREEPGGDQPPPPGPVPVQPTPGTGQASGPSAPIPAETAAPVEPLEPAPAKEPLLTCIVTTVFQQQDGGALVDVAAFHVVDLRPRIRVTNFRMIERESVTFADRSDGLIQAWAWSFGDGARSTDQHPTHTYSDRGCLDASLRVSSPFSHWLTGRQFEATEVRTLPINPRNSDTHVEVLVIDLANGW